MKAIQTHYYGPTDTRGARITATAEGGKTPHRISINYPHELSEGETAHQAAALVLCKKIGWSQRLIGGGLPNGDYCFVFAPDAPDMPARVHDIFVAATSDGASYPRLCSAIRCATNIRAAEFSIISMRIASEHGIDATAHEILQAAMELDAYYEQHVAESEAGHVV